MRPRIITRIVKLGGRANDHCIAADIDKQARWWERYEGKSTYLSQNLRHDANAWRNRKTPTLVILSRRKPKPDTTPERLA